jgi:predicted permease
MAVVVAALLSVFLLIMLGFVLERSLTRLETQWHGLALASVAMVAIIPLVNVFSVAVLAHYASPEKQSARAIVMTVVRNPLIWACAIGLAPDDRLKNAKPARSPAPPRRNC